MELQDRTQDNQKNYLLRFPIPRHKFTEPRRNWDVDTFGDGPSCCSEQRLYFSLYNLRLPSSKLCSRHDWHQLDCHVVIHPEVLLLKYRRRLQSLYRKQTLWYWSQCCQRGLHILAWSKWIHGWNENIEGQRSFDHLFEEFAIRQLLQCDQFWFIKPADVRIE